MSRRGIGHVFGVGGSLGDKGQAFYEVRLSLKAVDEIDQLLAGAAGQRGGISLTSDLYNPDRLRLTEVDPPQYELAAAQQYVRGNTLRISGQARNSCNIDVSARFGVPALLQELRQARDAARDFVVLRVPSRSRDLVEFIPDVAIGSNHPELAEAGDSHAGEVWPRDDFSDWEENGD